MRRIIATMAVVLVCTIIATPLQALEKKELTFTYQGLERTYYFFMPQKLNKKAALVFWLHGIGGTMKPYVDELVRLGNRDGFAVCVPFGWPEPGSTQKTGQWNAHYSYQKDNKVDDIGFLNALAQYLQKEYGLNPKKTFATGHSNGADLIFEMARDPRNVFTAFAPVSGFISVKSIEEQPLPSPVPMLIIHGTKDDCAPWEGDYQGEKGYGPFVSVPMAVRYWTTANRCTHREVDLLPLMSRQVISIRYRSCITTAAGLEAETRLYQVIDGGHGWPDADMETYWEILKFFDIIW